MCSIMGYCKAGADMQVFQEGFARTASRGPDDIRIADTGNGILGFQRLAVMGLHPEGMQPFRLGKIISYATEKSMDLRKSEKNCPVSTLLSVIRIVKYCFPCMKNMVWKCFPCWMRNMR